MRLLISTSDDKTVDLLAKANKLTVLVEKATKTETTKI